MGEGIPLFGGRVFLFWGKGFPFLGERGKGFPFVGEGLPLFGGKGEGFPLFGGKGEGLPKILQRTPRLHFFHNYRLGFTHKERTPIDNKDGN